jgi:hypothetical protein
MRPPQVSGVLTGYDDGVFDANVRREAAQHLVLCELLDVVGAGLAAEDHAAGTELD